MVFSSPIKMVAQYTPSSVTATYLFPQSNRFRKAQPSLVTAWCFVCERASERTRRGATRGMRKSNKK